jgi:KaiC/GvpD/RAD55 family RecA-like ATPase
VSPKTIVLPENERWLRLRDHPYREEGGIVVYPSMHFVLSRYKYRHAGSPDGSAKQSDRRTKFATSRRTVQPVFDGLEKLLSKGFVQGRCVALTGDRGTHKSRLAYLQLLYTLLHNRRARAILITLGDDEPTTLDNLARIASHQLPQLDVRKLEREGRLEIAYFPPGFITPEEFFNRLQLSIARNRSGAKDVQLLVAFNSLALLASHFPLCAEHKIFIPAVVELLEHEGVTSFFVSATGMTDEHGLLSLADPILHFERKEIDVEALTELLGATKPLQPNSLSRKTTIVEMNVQRFAGGTSAGESAHLALFERSPGAPFTPGLYFSYGGQRFEGVRS